MMVTLFINDNNVNVYKFVFYCKKNKNKAVTNEVNK